MKKKVQYFKYSFSIDKKQEKKSIEINCVKEFVFQHCIYCYNHMNQKLNILVYMYMKAMLKLI